MPMDGWGVMQQATELARRGEPFALATVVWRQGPSSSQQGAKALITADGELAGWIGGAWAEPGVVCSEPVLPVPRLVVVGSSPMANTLADLGRALGWQVDMIAGSDFTAADATERSLVVVATQGHDDESVLERAGAARPAYLGLVGSHKRGDAVLGYLADRGADREALARVRVPAGLDLGSTGHREIAVAI